MSLEYYLREDQLEFFAEDKKIHVHDVNFENGNWGLLAEIKKYSLHSVRISGVGIEQYLCDEKNVKELSALMMQMVFDMTSPRMIHVDANVHYLSRQYDSRRLLFYDPVQKHDVTEWVGGLCSFDRMWNRDMIMALDDATPNFKLPKNEFQFKEAIALNSMYCVVGTKDQIYRYRSFVSFTKNKTVQKRITKTLNHFAPLH